VQSETGSYLVPLRLGRGLGEAQRRLLDRVFVLTLGEEAAQGVDGNRQEVVAF